MDLPTNMNFILASITNDDGLEGTLLIYGELPNPHGQIGIIIHLLFGIAIAIPVLIVVLIKTGRLYVRRT